MNHRDELFKVAMKSQATMQDAIVGATLMFDGGRDAQVEWRCGYCNTEDFLVLSLRKTIKEAGRDLYEDQCSCCFNYQQIEAASIASEAAHLVQNGTLGY